MGRRRTRRQHVVPQLHLRHFTDGGGMLWCYDAQNDEVRSISPRDAAVETDFYSVLGKDGKHNDALDDWLAGVENNAAPHYSKLLRGWVLKGQEKADSAIFLSSLFVRSPAMIRVGAELKGMLVQRMSEVYLADRDRFEQVMDKRDAERGKRTDQKRRDEIFAFANDKSKYVLQIDRKVGLPIMGAADRLTDIFHEMGWLVLHCEDQHLITSDAPITRLTPTEDYHPIYGDHGFMNRRTYVTFPLSPSKALSMEWIEQPAAGPYRVDKDMGRRLNRQRAHFAERFLYASKHDSGIQALAWKYQEPGLQFEFSGQNRMPRMEIKRKPKKRLK